MCIACQHPAAPGHWAEAGVPSGLGRERHRDRTARLVEALLAADGITVRRLPRRGGMQLTAPSGRSVVARTIDDVWEAAAALAGRRAGLPFLAASPEGA